MSDVGVDGGGAGGVGRATLGEAMAMSAITLDLPDDLAERRSSLADRLPRILALGVHEVEASPSQFAGTSEVLELLATLPSPEETLALHPSPKLQARMTELLEKNRTIGLTSDEREEIRHYGSGGDAHVPERRDQAHRGARIRLDRWAPLL